MDAKKENDFGLNDSLWNSRRNALIPLHAFGGEDKKIFVMFHIICTFAMQSRAFLSQLSVTGDESGFFYAFLRRYIL